MVEKSITGIVSWLKNWFYDSDQVDVFLESKVNKNLGQAGMNVVTDVSGEISLEAKPTIPTVPNASTTTPSPDTISGAVGTGTTWAKADHVHPRSNIYASSNHQHNNVTISSSDNGDIGVIIPGMNQPMGLGEYLKGLEDDISDLASIEVIKVVSDKGTASANTMNKLYIENNGTTVDVWYTVREGNTYVWQKMDTDILDQLSIEWSDLTDNPVSSSTPSSFATNNHSHGNITNNGTIGSQPNMPLITGANGSVGLGSFGTTSGTFCEGNDSRLSNARTPTSHTHGNITNDGKIGSTSGLIVTTGSGGSLTTSNNISANKIVIDSQSDYYLNEFVSEATSVFGYAIDWNYNQNGFTNGVRLEDRTATGDDATGTITFRLVG